MKTLLRLRRLLKSPHELIVWIGLGLSAIATLPVFGAERIQFFYGPFEPTILVEDLEAIAAAEDPETVDAPWLDQLTEAQLTTLQTFLNYRFEVDVVMMSQISYSDVGENLLSRVGQIIQTESGLNGQKALRSALIAAAADNQGLSILNVIRQFPLDTIQLNWPLVQKVLAENQAIFQEQVNVIADLQQQAQTSAAQSLSTEDLSQMGTYGWQQETITFTNPNRSTPSVADVYVPQQEAESIPVIVISHGVASNLQTFAYLAKHLASHGYGVVVVDHTDTNTGKFDRFLTGLDGPPDPQSLLHRPADISAVLDTLEQQSVEESNLRSLNLESVGVLGHSLGGYTGLAVAGATLQLPRLNQVCSETVAEQPLLNLSMLIQCRFDELPDNAQLAVQDDRVEAVIAMNPLTSHIFGPEGMASLTVPTMLMASTDDYFVPALPEQIEPFQWLTMAEKYLVIVENGTHFTPLDASEQVLPAPEFLMGPDSTLAQPALKSLTLAFFDRHLRKQSYSEAYLTQSYLNRFGESPFQFSIVQQYSNSTHEPY
ncbi:MAG: alpha/beta fold hydrolase [Cyanobacteria bacterium J06639_14]